MTTLLFFLSMIVLLGMISWKAIELKYGKVHFISDNFRRADSKMHEAVNKFWQKHDRWSKIANIFVFDFVPSLAYEYTVKAKDYISKKYYESGDGFRGRRVLRTDGSVSFFLKRLADEKPGVDSRRI